jgi:hypothetical protein
MWAPLEKVQSYANLVAFGVLERNKLSLADYDIRDLAAEQHEAQEQERAREVAEATRGIFSDAYRRAVIGQCSVPDPFTVAEQTVPAGEHTIVGSINGDVLYDAAIVYDTGITDPDTGKKVRFVAPFSIYRGAQ